MSQQAKSNLEGLSLPIAALKVIQGYEMVLNEQTQSGLELQLTRTGM